MDRHHRLRLALGEDDAAALRRGHVAVVGLGALGSTVAGLLGRAGLRLTLIDRDVVDETNLGHQTLYTQADVGEPKPHAAAARLREVDPALDLTPLAADVTPRDLGPLDGVDVIADCTDNAPTRYLLNDLAVSRGVGLAYAGCVGGEGRALAVTPGGPCLRCVFQTPPAAGEVATCDTAGVLGPAAAVAAAWQAGLVMNLLRGHVPSTLLTFDLLAGEARTLTAEPNPACPCCGGREFPFLAAATEDAVTLCGRDTVQVRGSARVDLGAVADRWRGHGAVAGGRHMLRLTLDGRTLTLFPDGRLLVQGTQDAAVARTLYDRYVGR